MKVQRQELAGIYSLTINSNIIYGESCIRYGITSIERTNNYGNNLNPHYHSRSLSVQEVPEGRFPRSICVYYYRNKPYLIVFLDRNMKAFHVIKSTYTPAGAAAKRDNVLRLINGPIGIDEVMSYEMEEQVSLVVSKFIRTYNVDKKTRSCI